MRPNPQHECNDPEVVRRLITENPWATLVSNNGSQIVASHYPILLDDESEELAIFTHVGRPDETIHRFRDEEVLLIVQGCNGYVSPSWYAPGAIKAPTWNFSVAHCYGVPEVLSPEENLKVLSRLVAHFEHHVEEPLYLDPEWAWPLSQGTQGIRLAIRRFVCKIKMSQDKDEETQKRVMAQLRSPGPYQNHRLADDMQRALTGG